LRNLYNIYGNGCSIPALAAVLSSSVVIILESGIGAK
jgi:hypothetical protein